MGFSFIQKKAINTVLIFYKVSLMLKRIIPVLLLSGKGLVKTRGFSDPKYVGDAINAVRIFSEKEVDELVFLDIGATKCNREPNYDLIKAIASEAYMPFAYGGGVKTLRQAEEILKNGAEKIIINNAFLSNNSEISQMVREFGSQSVVICIDVKKNLIGKYKIFDHKTGKTSAESFMDYLKKCHDIGFGEVIIQNVDLEGNMAGYDLKLIELARKNISMPLVILGGAGSYDDLKKAFKAGADAAAAGSLFIFYGKYRAVLITYPDSKQIKRILNYEMC
jgi:cyclase